MFINKNLRETAFNYCAQWSGISDQKIDFLLFKWTSSLTLYKGFHQKEWLPQKGMHPPHLFWCFYAMALHSFKVNESRYIALFVDSEYIKKLF